ncbi:hypothetical protein AB0I55_26400 [Actinocatenispora sera]|uniref:hypothetical protein n=1 Tax=Actinocatenispora sera TaxID=390989 RepID=UPI0033E6288D
MRLDADEVLGRVTDLVDRTPAAFADAAAEVGKLVGAFPVIDTLVDSVATYTRNLGASPRVIDNPPGAS